MKINPLTSLYLNNSTFSCKKPQSFSGIDKHANDIYTKSSFCPHPIVEKYEKLQQEGETEQILNDFGIKTKRTKDGKLVISHYRQPHDYTFKEAGINENKLVKDVVAIVGNADFTGSSVTNLSKLRKVGGHFKAENHKSDINLNSLERVGTNVDVSHSSITSMPKLISIGGWAYCDNSKISNLDSLQKVDSWLSVAGTKIEDLPSLESVGADVCHSNLMSDETIKRVDSKCANLHKSYAKLC